MSVQTGMLLFLSVMEIVKFWIIFSDVALSII